jgi:hypothetical protein
MTIEQFPNLVIGSGVAAKLLAWALAKQGQKTVVVERAMVGGSCPNVACLPSKNVIYSAKAVSLVHPTAGLGVVTGSVRVDMAGVARRKRQMVDGLVKLHLDNFTASGAELVMGEARFTEPKTVRVTRNAGGTRLLLGERVFINVGTRARVPDVPGLVIAGPMTHVEALNLERLPGHLVILGGGYVGLEFAQAMRRFGSLVTIVQRGPRLLEREDPDVADALLELMKDEGVEVLLQSEVLSVTGRSGTGVALQVRSGATARTLEASDILAPAPNPGDPMTQTTKVAHRTVKLRDLDVFYREAGPKDAPAVLLLHGFPTSSQMFRNLIPALADRYHVLAPDYPGFGHSSMPPRHEFAYTFDNIAAVVEEFTTIAVRVSIACPTEELHAGCGGIGPLPLSSPWAAGCIPVSRGRTSDSASASAPRPQGVRRAAGPAAPRGAAACPSPGRVPRRGRA